MIESELLQEKRRVQKRLSSECESVHDYVERSRLAAAEVAATYGLELEYARPSTSPSQRGAGAPRDA